MKYNLTYKILFLIVEIFFIFPISVRADGTRDMYDWNVTGTNNRWFFDNNSYNDIAALPNNTIIKVYANKGEKIKFATSGTGAIMTKPNGTTETISVTRSNGSVGHIYDYVQEKNRTYTYKVIDALESGIYIFEMTNTRKAYSGQDYMNITNINNSYNFLSQDNGTHIAAWDIQIEDGEGIEIDGRVWMDYISISRGYNSGNYSRGNVKFHVLTSDGYKYSMSMRGADPGGFNFFVGTRGFINKNTNEIYYKSISDSQLNNPYLMPTPTYGENEFDTYGKIFFKEPSDDLPHYISKDKLNSEIVDELYYNNNNTGETKLFGIFSFEVSEPSIYTLVIKNKATGNVVRTISNTAVEGINKIIWNCKDNSGNYVPAGEYTAEIKVRNGEYHFILYDVETLEGGFSITSEDGEHTVYYDNTTTGGANASENGVDSSTNPLKFGTSGGDHKLLNVWTYNNEKSSIDILMLNEDDDTKCVISGRIFKDNDNNKVFNTLYDIPISDAKINITDLNTNEVYEAYSVTNGEFAAIVPKGSNYKIDVDSDYRLTKLKSYVNTTNNNESQTRNNVTQSINVGDIGYYSSQKEITIKKVWDDNDNQFGLRANSINVNIKNGNDIVDSVQLKANSGWEKTINLPKKDSSGNEIEYTIEEEEISDFYTTSNSTITNNNSIYTIINKFVIPFDTIDLNIEKIWNDDNNYANKRPESVTVKLYIDGVETNQTFDITENDDWKTTISNLPKYDINDAHTIEYSVVETNTGNDFYSLESMNNNNYKISITNKFNFEQEKFKVKIIKKWEDNNDSDRVRPNKINIKLMANGILFDEYDLNSNENWTYTFNNLNRYDERGADIEYTILENDTSEYTIIDTIVNDNNEEREIISTSSHSRGFRSGRNTSNSNSNNNEVINSNSNSTSDKKVLGASENPKTLDNVYLYVIIFVLGIICLLGIKIYKKVIKF